MLSEAAPSSRPEHLTPPTEEEQLNPEQRAERDIEEMRGEFSRAFAEVCAVPYAWTEQGKLQHIISGAVAQSLLERKIAEVEHDVEGSPSALEMVPHYRETLRQLHTLNNLEQGNYGVRDVRSMLLSLVSGTESSALRETISRSSDLRSACSSSLLYDVVVLRQMVTPGSVHFGTLDLVPYLAHQAAAASGRLNPSTGFNETSTELHSEEARYLSQYSDELAVIEVGTVFSELPHTRAIVEELPYSKHAASYHRLFGGMSKFGFGRNTDSPRVHQVQQELHGVLETIRQQKIERCEQQISAIHRETELPVLERELNEVKQAIGEYERQIVELEQEKREIQQVLDEAGALSLRIKSRARREMDDAEEQIFTSRVELENLSVWQEALNQVIADYRSQHMSGHSETTGKNPEEIADLQQVLKDQKALLESL